MMNLFPKKIRPPQMWWIIEQQARRRRAHSETSAPATAEWLPHSVLATWHDSVGSDFGDWDAFSIVDPSSVVSLDLLYAGISSISGLENLLNLTSIELSYNDLSTTGIPLLPAGIEAAGLTYCGLSDVPDFSSYPNIVFLNLSYNLLTSEQLDAICIQLDANGKTNGILNLSYNGNEVTAASLAARNSLQAKGWSLNTNI